MVLWLEAVSFDVADAPSVAAFWAGLLERDVVTDPGGVLVPGDDTQVGLRFVSSANERVGRSKLHLHLTSSSAEDQQRTVEAALRLGGRHLDVGQGPDEPFVVLADPGENELCVIEAGNNYLAGTGRLGEVTCDGTREVGLFWRDALGWPLVLNDGDQTAVQSPLGGTKISWDAWGVQKVEAGSERTWQRFELVTADVAGESERLVSLGATRLSDSADGVALADPDGYEFRLRPGTQR
ncbi:VOC family protein [Microlunatus sp. GCM10028923]|uniref:VOC family protein n=1 Tax=Microlunatus sp. GCM10028923 TaxID=3273400 RepID=UPI00361D1ACE